MNAITVSREFGAGGGEVARRLAEALGWELLDRELLHRAAAIEHVPDTELERLDEKALSMTDRLRLHPPHQRYMHGVTEAARKPPHAARSFWSDAAPDNCSATCRMSFICAWLRPSTGVYSAWPYAKAGRWSRRRRAAWKSITAGIASRALS